MCDDIIIEDGLVCAVMPALALFHGSNRFFPVWRLKESFVRKLCGETPYVCARLPPSTVIRVGKGWGRNGRDKYYYYDGRGVQKLTKRAVKRLADKKWITCAEFKQTREKICFEVTSDGIVITELQTRTS